MEAALKTETAGEEKFMLNPSVEGGVVV